MGRIVSSELVLARLNRGDDGVVGRIASTCAEWSSWKHRETNRETMDSEGCFSEVVGMSKDRDGEDFSGAGVFTLGGV